MKIFPEHRGSPSLFILIVKQSEIPEIEIESGLAWAVSTLSMLWRLTARSEHAILIFNVRYVVRVRASNLSERVPTTPEMPLLQMTVIVELCAPQE